MSIILRLQIIIFPLSDLSFQTGTKKILALFFPLFKAMQKKISVNC